MRNNISSLLTDSKRALFNWFWSKWAQTLHALSETPNRQHIMEKIGVPLHFFFLNYSMKIENRKINRKSTFIKCQCYRKTTTTCLTSAPKFTKKHKNIEPNKQTILQNEVFIWKILENMIFRPFFQTWMLIT